MTVHQVGRAHGEGVVDLIKAAEGFRLRRVDKYFRSIWLAGYSFKRVLHSQLACTLLWHTPRCEGYSSAMAWALRPFYVVDFKF